jgi:hypothetical protein
MNGPLPSDDLNKLVANIIRRARAASVNASEALAAQLEIGRELQQIREVTRGRSTLR